MRLVRWILFVGIALAQACASPAPTVPEEAQETQSPVPAPTATATESPPTPSPTIEELTPTSIQQIAGIWDSRVLSERGYHKFMPDGTMVLAYSIDGLKTSPVFSQPVPFWFEGEVFHVEDACGHGTYRLTLYREGGENRKLAFQVIEDPCAQRISDWKHPMRWYGP